MVKQMSGSPKRNSRSQGASPANEGENQRRMQKVNSLEEAVKTPSTYWVKQIEDPRWNLMISNFGNGMKLRVTAVTSNRQIVQIVNVNVQRLDRLIEILTKAREKLNQLGVSTNVKEEEDEW